MLMLPRQGLEEECFQITVVHKIQDGKNSGGVKREGVRSMWLEDDKLRKEVGASEQESKRKG